MTESDVALGNACLLAEEMIYDDLLGCFDEKAVIISDGQFERIQKLIYGCTENKSEKAKKKEKKASSRKTRIALLIAAILLINLSVFGVFINI